MGYDQEVEWLQAHEQDCAVLGCDFNAMKCVSEPKELSARSTLFPVPFCHDDT
jgi:hypothetical protein